MGVVETFNSKYQLRHLKVPRDRFVSDLRDVLDTKGTTWMEIGHDFTETARWGHNHDFGEGLVVVGSMENRHFRIADNFMNKGGMPFDLTGKKVLVVGCYTGGDALLIAARGAQVVAIEEVNFYSRIARWLAESFGANMIVHNISLDRDSTGEIFEEGEFDIIYNSGVIYHLRNIIVGLSHCHKWLKPGGTMYLETMISSTLKGHNALEYRGLNVPGYNWYLPTDEAVVTICKDVGLSAKHIHFEPNDRSSFVCKKIGS